MASHSELPYDEVLRELKDATAEKDDIVESLLFLKGVLRDARSSHLVFATEKAEQAVRGARLAYRQAVDKQYATAERLAALRSKERGREQ